MALPRSAERVRMSAHDQARLAGGAEARQGSQPALGVQDTYNEVRSASTGFVERTASQWGVCEVMPPVLAHCEHCGRRQRAEVNGSPLGGLQESMGSVVRM